MSEGGLDAKRAAALLALGLAMLIPLAGAVDLGAVSEYLWEIGPGPIAISILCVHVGVFFYALGWYFLLGGRLDLLDSFLISWASLFVNLLIPTGSTSGEALRVYLASKRGVNGAAALSSVVTHRVIMIIPFVVSVVLGLSFFASGGGVHGSVSWTTIWFLMAALALVVVALFYVSGSEGTMLRIVGLAERVLRRRLEGVRSAAREYVSAFREATRDGRKMLMVLSTSFANWLFDMAPIFIFFWSLGEDLSPLYGAFVYSVSIMLVLIPVGIPGNTGVREWALIALLSATGVSREVATVVTLMASTVSVFLNELISGMVAYLLALRRLRRPGSSPTPTP